MWVEALKEAEPAAYLRAGSGDVPYSTDCRVRVVFAPLSDLVHMKLAVMCA